MAEKYKFDPDNRRTPKTRFYCINCQRDIKGGSDHLRVSVDWDKLELWPDNNGQYKLGLNCWNKIKKVK